MFAVFMSGGKQYKVTKNDKIKIEKVPGEPGTQIEIRDVLLMGENGKSTIIGTPLVAGGVIFAEILDQARDPKIIVFKKKRRHNYRRKIGHRQYMTHVVIKDIMKK
jgi:large subunit ribosomal protein L21